MQLQNKSIHLALGSYRKDHRFQNTSSSTFPHYTNKIVAVVLVKAHQFNTYQILSYPFQLESWYLILALSTVTYVSTFFIYPQMITSKCLFKYTLLQHISILLGVPLSSDPKSLQKRLMILFWMLTSFILRAMYSSLLFNLIRTQAHHPLPRKLHDFIVHDYAAVLNTYTYNDLHDYPDFIIIKTMKHIVCNSTVEWSALEYIEQRPQELLFAIVSNDVLSFYVENTKKSGTFYVLPEVIVEQQLTIYLTKHSYLLDYLDNFIMLIKSSGFIDLWTNRGYKKIIYSSETSREADNLLEYAELHGLFRIVLGGYLLCIICFLSEHITIKLVFVKKLLAAKRSM